MTRPGDWLRNQCARFCSERTMSGLVDPIIADLQMEHAAAVLDGHRWKAAWIRIAACVALLRALPLRATGHGQWSRALRLSSASMLLLMLVFVMVNLSSVSGWTQGSQEMLVLLLIPAALGMAFPVGFTVALLYGLARRGASRPVVVAVLASAMVCSTGSILALGWIVPATNQAFREEAAGRSVRKGTNELTLPELRELVHSASAPADLLPQGGNAIAVSYYGRVAFACAPIALGLFALAVMARSRVERVVSGSAVLAAYFVYMFTLDSATGRAWSSALTPPVASWLPNLTVMALSMSMLLVSRLKPAPTTDS
jgi:hypothetical protein